MDTHHETRVGGHIWVFFSRLAVIYTVLYIYAWQLVTVGNARIRCAASMTTHSDQYFDEYMVPSIVSFL